jgi:CHASE2 domain-containing sensor protein
MEYENFDISIDRVGDRYEVSLIESDVKAYLCDEIDGPEMRRKQLILEKSFPDEEIPADLRKIIDQPEQYPIDASFLEDYGRSLYTCLFRNDIRDAFKEAYGRATANDGGGLRVRLMIKPARIARLPWELMHDNKDFLATSETTSIVRFPGISEKRRKLTVNWPVKVLIGIPDADEKDGNKVNAELEKTIVCKAFKELRDAHRVRLDFIEGEISTDSLDEKLDEGYHIFHYIGHGCFENDEGYLKIKRCTDDEEDPSNKREKPGWLRAASFARLFSNHPSVKLVVLNSCQGAKISSITQLSGVAPRLVDTGIPAVVAMQYPIFDDSARTFSQKFYGSLCNGRDRGLLDVAIISARNLMLVNRMDDPDFATPVLFMRTKSGLIFDLNTAPQITPSTIEADRPQVSNGSPIPSLELIGDTPRLKALRIARRENLFALDQEEVAAKTDEERRRIEQDKVEEKAKLADVDQLLSRAARVWMRLIWAAFVVSCIVLVGAFFGVFNVIKVGDYLNDVRHQQILRRATGAGAFGNGDIRVILVNPNERLNGFPHSEQDRRLDREKHAQLIDALANAGAKVVAFDIVMDQEKISPFDKQLANSIDQARQKGTQVISGVELQQNAQPEKQPPADLVNALNDRLGNVNVGLDYQLGSLSFDGFRPVIRHVELAKMKPQEASNGLAPVYPSLMLQAIRLFRATSATDIPEAYLDRRGNQPRVVLMKQNGEVVEDIPVVDEDMTFTIAPGPDSDLAAVRRSYKDVYNQRNNPAFMSDYLNKIVWVGYGVDSEEVYVSTTHRRYGVELQAEAVSNIFQKIYIKNIPWTVNLAITFGMIVMGLLLALAPFDKLNYRIPTDIKLLRNILRVPLGLILATFIYFLIVGIVYAKSTYMIEMSYHVFALFVGYLLGVYKRRQRLKEGVAKV